MRSGRDACLPRERVLTIPWWKAPEWLSQALPAEWPVHRVPSSLQLCAHAPAFHQTVPRCCFIHLGFYSTNRTFQYKCNVSGFV